MAEQPITSPYTGLNNPLRESVIQGAPVGSMVFSSQSISENASAFVRGFLRPGDGDELRQFDGLLPSVLNYNFNTGDSQLGDVSVSAGEKAMVAKYPDFFRKLVDILTGPWGWLVWVGVFFALVSFTKFGRKKWFR